MMCFQKDVIVFSRCMGKRQNDSFKNHIKRVPSKHVINSFSALMQQWILPEILVCVFFLFNTNKQLELFCCRTFFRFKDSKERFRVSVSLQIQQKAGEGVFSTTSNPCCATTISNVVQVQVHTAKKIGVYFIVLMENIQVQLTFTLPVNWH